MQFTADYVVGTFSQAVSIIALEATERERGRSSRSGVIIGSQQIDSSLAGGAQDPEGDERYRPYECRRDCFPAHVVHRQRQ